MGYEEFETQVRKRVRGESNVWWTEDMKSIRLRMPDGYREISSPKLPLFYHRAPLNLEIRSPAKHVKLVTLRTVFQL